MYVGALNFSAFACGAGGHVTVDAARPRPAANPKAVGTSAATTVATSRVRPSGLKRIRIFSPPSLLIRQPFTTATYVRWWWTVGGNVAGSPGTTEKASARTTYVSPPPTASWS